MIDLVETKGGGLTICAVYPSPDSRPNECKPGREGRMNVRNNDVQVDFSLKLPAGVSLVARTVNGSIHASLDRSVGAGPMSFKTVNGSVTVTLPSDLNADLHAETVNGGISNEFRLSQQTKRTRRHLEGTIGKGGRNWQ